MATPVLITSAQLERRFGAATVRGFADDTGDNSGAAVVVADALLEASARALSILRAAWSTDQIALMCTAPNEDLAVVGACCDIAISILARRRPALLGVEGIALYASTEKSAEARLRELAKGNQRPDGERVAGANTVRTVAVSTNREAKHLVFQATTENPRGKGGF